MLQLFVPSREIAHMMHKKRVNMTPRTINSCHASFFHRVREKLKIILATFPLVHSHTFFLTSHLWIIKLFLENKYWLITVNKFFLISLWHRELWTEKRKITAAYKERWWEHFNISTNTAHCTAAYEWGAHIKNIMKICRHPHVMMLCLMMMYSKITCCT